MPLTPPQTLGLYTWQRDEALTRLRVFRDQMVGRVFPAFANIEQEAREHGDAVFQQALAGPIQPNIDESTLAEHAHEAAQLHYSDLEQVLQTSINFAAATIFHAHWETPVRDWLGREAPMFGASKGQMKKIEGTKLDDIATFLASHGWSFAQAGWFSTLDELRLVANTVKHARGDSARALFERRPKLFWPYNIVGEDEYLGSAAPDGTNLVITPEDFATYAEAVEAFWVAAPAGDEG